MTVAAPAFAPTLPRISSPGTSRSSRCSNRGSPATNKADSGTCRTRMSMRDSKGIASHLP
eukprot:1505006-Rhodomonas_salina.1